MDQVRHHCQTVVKNAALLTVCDDQISGYARHLPAVGAAGKTAHLLHSESPDHLERRRLTVLAMAAVNFGSGWHDVISKRPNMSGARSMAASIRDLDSEQGPLTPDLLQKLTPAKCTRIFGQDESNADALELMGFFAVALNDLGIFLAGYGSAGELVDQSKGSAVRFAQLLTEMPMFNDTGFFKRAQLAAADFARNGLADLSDLASLTAFADNLVPHVLFVDGIVELSSQLRDQIGRGEQLPPGGLAEREIRAVAVWVVDQLATVRPDLRPMDIDEALWTRGGGSEYKSVPRPRCRSVYY